MTLGTFLARDNGGAAVEMGVLFPLFMILTTGLVDVGVEMLSMMAVNNAAQAGATYYVINPTASASNITTVMNSASGLTTIQAVPAPSLVGGVITVTAQFPYTPILPWSTTPTTLTSAAIVRIQ
jgi:hypothetical protein